MSGKGIKYEKAKMDSSDDDIELPMATAEAVAVLDHDGGASVGNLVTAIFEKASKDSKLGIIWDIVDNEIVLTGFDKNGLAMTQPNNLEIGMTLISVNGVSFVSGKADDGGDVFLDEEEGASSMMGLVTEDTVIEASNIMRNAEGTLTIVARKNPRRTNTRRTKRTNNKMRRKANNRNPGSPAPPPGAPEGGVWGTTLYYGPTSQLSSVLCCVLGGLIPASIMCCMPFDKRRVYFAHNRYYGEFGGVVSVGENSLKFKQEDQPQSSYDSDAATSACCIAFAVVIVLTVIMIVIQTAAQTPKSGYHH